MSKRRLVNGDPAVKGPATPSVPVALKGPRFARWAWVALAIVVLLESGIAGLKRGLIPARARAPRHSLSELPQQLGQWTGADIKVDPAIAVVIGTDETINRGFRDPQGTRVAVHCATWTATWNSTDDWTPHTPEYCYPASGWSRLRGEILALPEKPHVQVALQTYEREGRRVRVAFWFQIGALTYTDREGGRKALEAFWGAREWPPLTKVLLQTEDAEHADSKLLELADRIYQFNCAL